MLNIFNKKNNTARQLADIAERLDRIEKKLNERFRDNGQPSRNTTRKNKNYRHKDPNREKQEKYYLNKYEN